MNDEEVIRIDGRLQAVNVNAASGEAEYVWRGPVTFATSKLVQEVGRHCVLGVVPQPVVDVDYESFRDARSRAT